MSAPQILIAGCGYVGAKAATLFSEAGWDVTAITHSAKSAAHLALSHGIRALACDISNPGKLQEKAIRIGDPGWLIHCASSGRGGVESYRRVYLEGTRNLLRQFPRARFFFTGSTSVYAQTDGSLVTEESPAEPARETGLILRKTEGIVLGSGGTALRLAGIYGPGRSHLLQKFFDGTATMEDRGERRINQIHRDDASSALFFLASSPHSAGIYNVADDCPIRQRECYEWLAARFHRPMPPAAPADFDRKRGWTNKQVSNAKLKNLGWTCLYPSFKEAVERDTRLLEGITE